MKAAEHTGGMGKHERANLYRADAAFQIKLIGQGHSRELLQWDMRQKGSGIQIDGVSAGWLNDGHAVRGTVLEIEESQQAKENSSSLLTNQWVYNPRKLKSG